MLEKLSITLEKGDTHFLAFCPQIPEANGQGLTAAEAVEDLASSVAFLLLSQWEDDLGLSTLKPKIAAEQVA